MFDKAGNAFVGDAGTKLINKFNPLGMLLNSTTVPVDGGIISIDLATDQKTAYYTSSFGVVHRADTSTNTVLSDFATFGGTAVAVRLLSDGGALVVQETQVLRLDSSGTVVKTYTGLTDARHLYPLTLDPGGMSFWAGDVGRANNPYSGSTKVYRVDIETGAILTTFQASKDGAPIVTGLAIFQGITQNPSPTQGTPEPATFALAWLALLGTCVAKRKRLRIS